MQKRKLEVVVYKYQKKQWLYGRVPDTTLAGLIFTTRHTAQGYSVLRANHIFSVQSNGDLWRGKKPLVITTSIILMPLGSINHAAKVHKRVDQSDQTERLLNI